MKNLLMYVFIALVFSTAVCADEKENIMVKECFDCHETELTTFSLTKHAEEGTCAICHENADLHLNEEEKLGNIINPGHLSLRESNMLCLNCHEEKDKDVYERFKSNVNAHNQLRCIDCHKMHSKVSDTQWEQDSFSITLSVNCQTCHQKKFNELEDSEHGFSGLTCVDCHKSHEVQTSSMDIEKQIKNCFSCHPSQDLEFKYPYTHPLRERQIKCTDCHSPHSSRNNAMLKERGDKVCAQCHMNIAIEGGKHPASQGTDHPFRKVKCLDCHQAHGADFSAVLKHDVSHLCQTCHN